MTSQSIDNTVAAATRAGAIAQTFIVKHQAYSKRQLHEFLERKAALGSLSEIIDDCAESLEDKIRGELTSLSLDLDGNVEDRIIDAAVSIAKKEITEIIHQTLGVSATTMAVATVDDKPVNPVELARARKKVNAFYHRKKSEPDIRPTADVKKAQRIVNQVNYQRRKLKKTVLADGR